MTVYIELGDFCEIAAEILGTSPEQIARLPRIAAGEATFTEIVAWIEPRTAASS